MAVKKVVADEVPHLCQIELTYECNQNCIFCYNPLRGEPVDVKKMDEIVHRVYEARVPQVYLIGGEPSLLGAEKLNEYVDKLTEYSAVSIVTNGYIKLEGISDKVSCIAVPLHGHNAETHEAVNGKPGSFEKTLESIKYYVSRGIDVRCVLVLTGYTYDKMLDIISLAASLGMESIYVDRYEDGGIGSCNSANFKLKPSLEEFRHALTDIIYAKKHFKGFKGKVGFGTAIPYCVDERLFHEGLLSSCGAGSTFCAINNKGDVRLCNQSDIPYGNILENTMLEIWNHRKMDEYRDLEWVSEPCKSCAMLQACQCGCRVDANCSSGFCIDYAVREKDQIIDENIKKINNGELNLALAYASEQKMNTSEHYKVFIKDRYLRTNRYDEEYFLVTKYQGTKIGKEEYRMMAYILSNDVITELDLINHFEEFNEDSIKTFVSYLEYLGAIQIKGEILNDSSVDSNTKRIARSN